MDLEKILSELRNERAMVEEAIIALEKFERTKATRRGRPPKWQLIAVASEEKNEGTGKRSSPRKRKALSAAQP